MNSEVRTYRDPQEVAFTLATYISRAKTDKEAVKIFANSSGFEYGPQRQARKLAKMYLNNPQGENTEMGLLPADQERLMVIRRELSDTATEKLAEKKGKISTRERVSILLQAKFKSGLDREQRIKMYKEAGYTDDEILFINGSKIAGTVIGNIVIGTGSWAGLGVFTVYDNALPFFHLIPSSTEMAFAAIGIYTASYIANTEQNLRLTKTFGASIGTLTTGLFALGNRLLPEKERDWIARVIPVLEDGIARSGLYAGAVAGITGDPHKVIAGCLFGAALNAVIITGSEIVLRGKKKKIA